MSNDSGTFRTPEEVPNDGSQSIGLNRIGNDNEILLPLYEGKMVQAFDHRAADATENRQNIVRQGQQTTIQGPEKKDPNRFPLPRYFVKVEDDRWPSPNEWIIAYKSVTSATNALVIL